MSEDLLAGIRDRRQADVDEALALLDAAASVSASSRRSLLSMASRSLADPVVLERWVRLAASESNAEIKQDMVSRLGNVDHRHITDVPAYIALMAGSVVDPYLRPVALGALSGLAVAYPGAVDALEQAYAGQPSATARRQILIGLCQLYRLPPGLADFLAAEIDNCDADVKVLAVDRLLRHNAPNAAMLAHWLEPHQPSGVKERVLQHLLDRSLAMGREVAEVLRTEGEASVRLLAVRALTAQSAGAPGPVQALLDAVRSDPDEEVRAEAVKAFQHAMEPTPQILRSLLAALNAEKSETVARLVLSSLTPFVRSSTEARDALLDLVDQNLRPEMVATVVEMLGQVLRWDAALLPIFLDRYRSSGNDHVRALLLEAMARYTDTDERLVELYIDAIGMPDARTRQWGVVGLLMVPMSQDQVPAVARGAQSLLDPLIDLNLRRALAAKIARVPQLPTELRATLAEVSEHTDDPILRSTCRQVLARSRDSESTEDEELERWLHQVEVEESVEAVFPDVFARYDANPSLCAKILKACVLNPACREKLYYNSFPVSDTAIIRFLISRDALDDDLCRYCVDQALTTPGPGWYVRALCCRPDFAGLAEAVWRVLEGAGPTSAAYHNSMRDLMVHAFGSENAAVGALQSRLERLTSPASAVPYMRFLNDLRSWPAVRTVISDLLRSGRLLDPTNRGIWGDAVNDLFPQMAPQAPGPGLADE